MVQSTFIFFFGDELLSLAQPRAEPCRNRTSRKRFRSLPALHVKMQLPGRNASRHCWSKWSPYVFYSGVGTTADSEEERAHIQWCGIAGSGRSGGRWKSRHRWRLSRKQRNCNTSKADEKTTCNAEIKLWEAVAAELMATSGHHGLAKRKKIVHLR